jgi:hypothetical protein
MRKPLNNGWSRGWIRAALTAAQLGLAAPALLAQPAPSITTTPAPAGTAAPAPTATPVPTPAPEANWVYGGTPPPAEPRAWVPDAAVGVGPTWWGSAEFVVYQIRNSPLATPLLTSGAGDVSETAGAFGDASSFVILGGHDVNLGSFPGIRLQGGYLVPGAPVSLEAGALWLAKETSRFDRASTPAGDPLLAIPVNLFGTGETAIRLSDPTLFSGSFQGRLSSQFWGAEVNVVRDWVIGPQMSAGLLVGFRYLRLDESLNLAYALVPCDGDATATATDSWGAQNTFYGGQIGGRLSLRQDRLVVTAFNKIGLGMTRQKTTVRGNRSGTTDDCECLTSAGFFTTPSATTGVLTSVTDVGARSHDDVSVIDELGVNLSFEVTESITATLGYTFLVWTDVARPGDLINRNVAPEGVAVPAGGVFPSPKTGTSTFWAHGLNVGLEFRF